MQKSLQRSDVRRSGSFCRQLLFVTFLLINLRIMDLYRKTMVAGNWKMNTSLAEGKNLVRAIVDATRESPLCEVVVAPPFTHLTTIRPMLEGSHVKLAAQNCHQEKWGAYTGEISVDVLKEIGVEYVILGHSERRQYFHETHEMIRQKVDRVLDAGLKVIFCCGEPLDVRQAEHHNVFVRVQLEESLFHLSGEQLKHVCIAYEPIWAIGTGVTASPEQAQEMHDYIRSQISVNYDKFLTECTRILYGGSIKADNAKSLFTQEDVDGGLVGGASLDAKGFLEIVKAAC